MRRFLILLSLLCVSPALAQGDMLKLPSKAEKIAAPVADAKPADPVPPPEEATPHYNTVALQGLNKVTGHLSRLEGPVGTVLRFGNLEIITRRCWKSSPEERPENAALLDISELKPGEASQRIFLGWMFSSSPGLSGLEHPVYDITVLDCEDSKEPEKKDGN